MRSFTTVLCLALVSFALVSPSHAGRIPDALDKRLAEMNKWFEARIPIYEKANFLLQKLGKEVARLSDLHNGIDFYYEGFSDLQYYEGFGFKSPKLRVVKVSGDGVDMKPIDDIVRKALDKRTVKNILHLAPEIKTAFKSIMKKTA